MSTDRKPSEGGFFKFLYNKETGEVLGRTGSSWAKITIFYIIFYAALAAFFGLLLYIFYLTLNVDTPKYTQSESLIGTNPGVGFRPQPDQDANVDSTLIWFSKDSPDSEFWSNQLKKFVEDADNTAPGSMVTECNFKTVNDDSKTACKVNTKDLGPCKASNAFGFKTGQPCILLKLNRIFDWKPEVIQKDGDKNGKKDFSVEKFKNVIKENKMPQELKDYIITNLDTKESKEEQYAFASSVWISCEGENPADRENIGPFSFYPMPGIPSYYFPYKKQKGYQSPFLMVHLTRVLPGVLVNIECKAWAHNIIPDRQTRTGSVHFEMMID